MRFLAIFVALMMVFLVSAQDPCMKPCARNFDFVCGKFADGSVKTFSNSCVMEVEACQKGQGNYTCCTLM